MSLTYIFIIAIVLIAVIGLIVKVALNRKNKKVPIKAEKNSNYPEVGGNYFTTQSNETIDYITCIDSQKFKIVMLPSEKSTAITAQNTNGNNTNRAKSNGSKVGVKPNTLDFHLSEKAEQLHQLLLAQPQVEILKKEILKDKESLFNLDNLALLIIRILSIKLKSTNDTINYSQLILEVKHYLDRGNLLLENLNKVTSTQLDFKSQP